MSKYLQINKIIDKYLKKVSENIENDAYKRCPVRTGNLRDGIYSNKIDDLEYVIRNDVEYAKFVELGTSKMKAQPFLRKSLRNKKNYKI